MLGEESAGEAGALPGALPAFAGVTGEVVMRAALLPVFPGPGETGPTSSVTGLPCAVVTVTRAEADENVNVA